MIIGIEMGHIPDPLGWIDVRDSSRTPRYRRRDRGRVAGEGYEARIRTRAGMMAMMMMMMMMMIIASVRSRSCI